MIETYDLLKQELNDELNRILNYWANRTIDHEYGGFVGRIDHFDNIITDSSKGVILNTRILWSFSESSIYLNTDHYLGVCHRAYKYLVDFFLDNKHGGVYWNLDHLGHAIDKRKQVYAQAFTIYALTSYFQLTKKQEALNLAIELFELIEEKAADNKNGGYIEAFGEQWESIEDMRLSHKDMNAGKTMNTHLHLLECYTTLLRVHHSEKLRLSLKNLIELFLNTFLNSASHYDLFYDEHWKLLSDTVSYGHDIETAWLLVDAAKEVGDQSLIKKTQKAAIEVANVFLKEGLDHDNGVINETSSKNNIIDYDKHWWPQMEAMVGLAYAYNLTFERKYLEEVEKIWDFTKSTLIDRTNGDWHFRVNRCGVAYTCEDKVSMWKAPYHTTRSCIMMNSVL